MTASPRPRRKPRTATSSRPDKKPARRAAPAAPTARTERLRALVVAALEDMKAVNIKVLDVRGLTDIADLMVVASGNSDRHVRAIADNVARTAKDAGIRPFGTEGGRDGEWVLIDLPDVLVHVMLPRVREFYGLEELWEAVPRRRDEEAAAAAPAPRTAPRKSSRTAPRAPRRKSRSAPAG